MVLGCMISYFKNPVAIPGPVSLLAHRGRIRVHLVSFSVGTGDFPPGVQQQKCGLLISVDAWFLYRVTAIYSILLTFYYLISKLNLAIRILSPFLKKYLFYNHMLLTKTDFASDQCTEPVTLTVSTPFLLIKV